MLVKTRKIGATIFEMHVEQFDSGVDFTFSCNNWCSGFLIAKYGWSVDEIETLFDTENLCQWAADAWESWSESQRPC